MTDALRVELRGAGIRVALIEPVMTYSERDKDRFLQQMAQEFEAAIARLPDGGLPL
jgi:short-subunit dehydrogenase